MGIYTEMIKQRVFPTFLRVFFDRRLYLLSSSGPTGYSSFPVIFGSRRVFTLPCHLWAVFSIVIFGLDPEIQEERSPCYSAGPGILDSHFHGNDKRDKPGMTKEKKWE